MRRVSPIVVRMGVGEARREESRSESAAGVSGIRWDRDESRSDEASCFSMSRRIKKN